MAGTTRPAPASRRRRRRRVPRRAALAGALAGLLVPAAGCATAPGGQDPDGMGGEVVVFAASSMTDAIGAVADAFEDRHPGVTVTVSLAGSQQLAGQIVDGAPVDVFLSADRARMDQVVDAGRAAGEPVVVATNRLAVAVEPGNPHDVRGLEDLAREDLLIALAAPEVPAGAYAAAALDAAGVRVDPATLEPTVRFVLAKVELGEVDAGIVYRSDLVAAGDAVTGIEVPAEVDPRPELPGVVLTDAPNPAAARAFLEYLTSDPGRDLLVEHGFEVP